MNVWLAFEKLTSSFLWSFLAHDLIMMFLVPVVLFRRKEPAATIAWILAILLMPIVGAVAFLVFGNDRIARRASKRAERKRKVAIKVRQLVTNEASPIDAKGQLQLYRLLERINPLPPVPGNLVDVLTDIARNYELQIEAIEQARHHVHVEYYIFQPDAIGARFVSALARAAQRGVKVRFLTDAVGCMKLSRRFLKDLRSQGVETACFIPFNLLTRRFIFNFRNHRKIVVVDGKVGFTGGANVGLEYLGQSSYGPWHDTHLRLRGPVVRDLQRVFAEDWAFASGVDLSDEPIFLDGESAGTAIAQVVAGGPDMEVAVYHELFFSAAANAVSTVRIATPYFVPSEAISVALQTAARRGVDVQVLVPAVSTHFFVKWASTSYYEDLLEAGVKIFEYGKAFLHSKILTIDGRWSLVGSANFDNRSMKLNFEVGVVFYDADLTLQLDRLFNELLAGSVRIDAAGWSQRSALKKIAANTARLFSPIL